MEAILIWRFLKWVGLIFWGAGIAAVLVRTEREQKVSMLYLAAVSGFSISLMTGWMMMKSLGYGMDTHWIPNALLLGLGSLTGTFLSAFGDAKRIIWNTLSIAGFLGAIAIMVVRETNDGVQAMLLGLSLLMGAGIAYLGTKESVISDAEAPSVEQGFQWVARLEGLTVLVLFLLYIPAKKILGVNLDGGTGMIGWTHGVFVMVYILSLTCTARALGWSIKQWVIGGLSSFFPFGTFLFERHIFAVQKEPEATEI